MSAVESGTEIELKYRVTDLAAAERYLTPDAIGPFGGSATARSTQFEDRYVDTADGAIAQAGYAVRIRRTARGTVVSVKSLGKTEGAGGAMRREELEGAADEAQGPADWPESDARSLVLEMAGDADQLGNIEAVQRVHHPVHDRPPGHPEQRLRNQVGVRPEPGALPRQRDDDLHGYFLP